MTMREHAPGQPTVVVIGYGNELRGDDAAGPWVARAVASWELPDLQTYAVHQLTPELATFLAGVEYAFFVDALETQAELDLRVVPLEPTVGPRLAGHISDPGALLLLTRALYHRHPRAWLVQIPATSFEFGAGLSAATCRGTQQALRLIRDQIIALRGVARRRAG